MATKTDDSTKLMCVFSHLSGIFIGFIGPLIFYLIAEDKSVKENSKKALNWQLSLLIYSIISAILMIILIGFLLLIALGILNIIFSIIAAIRSTEGKVWDYPLTIPFLK